MKDLSLEYPAPLHARQGAADDRLARCGRRRRHAATELEMIEHDEHEYERSGMIYILPPFPEQRYFYIYIFQLS